MTSNTALEPTADCALSFDRDMKCDYRHCIAARATGGRGSALER